MYMQDLNSFLTNDETHLLESIQTATGHEWTKTLYIYWREENVVIFMNC